MKFFLFTFISEVENEILSKIPQRILKNGRQIKIKNETTKKFKIKEDQQLFKMEDDQKNQNGEIKQININ